MPDLGDQHAMAADLHVVADLHQIIDLGALADHRVAQGAAVDGGAGADLDPVLDDDPAQLRNLRHARLRRGKTETGLADLRAGQDRHPIADIGMADGDIAADLAIAADGDAGTDHGIGADAAAVADLRARPITTPGPSITSLPSFAAADRSPCLRPDRLRCVGIEQRGDGGKGMGDRSDRQAASCRQARHGARLFPAPGKSRHGCAAKASAISRPPAKNVRCAGPAPSRLARSAIIAAPSAPAGTRNARLRANLGQAERPAIVVKARIGHGRWRALRSVISGRAAGGGGAASPSERAVSGSAVRSQAG